MHRRQSKPRQDPARDALILFAFTAAILFAVALLAEVL